MTFYYRDEWLADINSKFTIFYCILISKFCLKLYYYLMRVHDKVYKLIGKVVVIFKS